METTAKKALQGIDTIIVRVSDVQASRQWYTEKLDLSPIWDDAATRLVVLDTGGPTSLTLWQTDAPVNNNRETASYPIFRTGNAAEARALLRAKGVSTGEVIEDGPVQYFFFYDPDGNVLEACQVHEM